MTGTRVIYAGTAAVLAVIAALSVVIYRANERDVVESFAAQQLAVAKSVGTAIGGEIKAITSSLRQFNTLPSVQQLDVDFTGRRVRAAFQTDDAGIIRQVVRIDRNERRYAWSLQGSLLERDRPGIADRAVWAWFQDRSHEGQVRVGPLWWEASPTPNLQAFAVPVWRVAASGENPVPENDFNGLLAFVIDVDRLLQAYARPEALDPMRATLSLNLGDNEPPVQIGQRAVREDDVLARSPLAVHGHEWTVAMSTPYNVASARVRDAGLRQFGVITALLVAVPVVGWLLVRRERRAEEERRALQIQLAQAQKMDAIGKLAGGVAHDFNNLLTAIMGYVSLILEDAPPKSLLHEEASQIQRAAESAAALTQKLLAFSRRQLLQPEQIDLTRLVSELLPIIKRLVGDHIEMHADLKHGLWPVVADPVQVEQAVINLAINARDAMPDGGTLHLSVRNLPMPQGRRRPDHDVPAGDYVQILVRDNGAGMDEATRARMFEPFFTTKPQGKGTGLGLSSVYGIVAQSGGYISVQSAPATGTTIELLLPRAGDATAAEAAPPPELEHEAQGRETVLLVEDDEAVRELTRTTLERHGYQVLAAASADHALRVSHDFRDAIALLLTDVVMPGMRGPELATRLRMMRPGVRVLFMSAHVADVGSGESFKDATLLQKPFSVETLTREVRTVLDR